MKANVGTLDRVVRVLIGVVLLTLTALGALGAWGWVGIVPIATAAFGYCPLYSVLGFSSCPVNRA